MVWLGIVWLDVDVVRVVSTGVAYVEAAMATAEARKVFSCQRFLVAGKTWLTVVFILVDARCMRYSQRRLPWIELIGLV
jgi:hypothetical protein